MGIKSRDPREYIVPAGSPVTVHYMDGRPPNETTFDHHYRFERKQIHNDLGVSRMGDGESIYIAICDVSKSVDAYVVKSDDIHLIETVAV